MISEKRLALQPLLESFDGIHLTAYLANRRGIHELKAQLRETLNVAQLYLRPVMNREDRQKFLLPLHSLLNDRRLLKELKGNFGVFRTQDSFRILKIPVEIEHMCVVATSFHVKPLLRWMQADREFLLLNLESKGAQLYHGSHFTLQCKEYIDFSKVLRQDKDAGDYSQSARVLSLKDRMNDSVEWLREWIVEYQKHSLPRLFLTGEKSLAEALHKQLRYNNVSKPALLLPLQGHSLSDVCLQIRTLLKNDAKNALDQAFLQFECAEELNLSSKNIFQIAKAATQGQVRKLIIADGFHLFGKLNPKTGHLTLHPGHLDHEDDDILDDLAQTVLAQGGEVIVAPRDQVPKTSPALAIFYEQAQDVASAQLTGAYDFPVRTFRRSV